MAVQKEWLKFFREQYPLGSRIKLRELEIPQEGLGRGSMGTLKKIDDNAGFHIEWENGQKSCLTPGYDSFSVLPPEPTMLKLYMPLIAEMQRGDYWSGDDDEPEEMTDYEILKYEDKIVAAMTKYRSPEEAERGLMHWYGIDDSVDEKVKSVVFTAEKRQGKLWGVAECQVIGTLSAIELETLKDYVTGQASDGWGEGFEQQEIRTGDGDMYVHLWNWENWDVLAEQERFSPKIADGLPEMCFSTLETTGELICLKRGEFGYYPSDWSTDDPDRNREIADYNNTRLGVSEAQKKAMEIGSMQGWGVPGADPACYETGSQENQSEDEGMVMGGM